MTENKENKTIKDIEKEIQELKSAVLKKELEVQKKHLEEELAKKANKQTRDFDESMLGVCHTCHVPIYYGEPIHKLQTRDEEGTYTGIAGGGYGGGFAGGGYHARSKKHSEIEG